MIVEQIEDDRSNEAKIEDARAVWHASEVALGILIPHYMPKKETESDVRDLLARY